MNFEKELGRIRGLFESGRWSQARVEAERVLAVFPDQAQLWFVLGASLHALGERRGAINAFRKTTELAPAFVPAMNAMATVLTEEGQPALAIEILDRSAALAPADAPTLFNRGFVLERLDRLQESLDAYEAAIEADASFAPAWLNRGALLMVLTRYEDAVDNNRQLIAFQPDFADAHCNLAEALLGLGLSQQALGACDRAIEIDPRHAHAHIDRGLALSDLGCFEDAQRAFESAETISPGAIRKYIDTVAPSDPSLNRVFDPRLVFLYRGYHRLTHCDWTLRNLYIEQLGKLAHTTGAVDLRHIDLPLAYHSLTVPVSQDSRYRIASTIGDRYASAVAETGIRFNHSKHGGRIRVGYLSADFWEHLNAYLSYPLFRMHDRNRFEVFAYSIGPDDGSAIRDRIKTSADRFVDLVEVNDLDAARRINGDGIDVLVDIGGYTQNCRPGIPAFRPAPVQVAYLGFPGTMGASWIDYRLTDHVATPAEQQKFWRERLVFLPDTFFTYDRFERCADVAVSRANYGLAEDAFVFCCFNNYYKIEPGIFAAWMDILKAVPTGVLWFAGRNSTAVANLRREADSHGVSNGRLVFAPFESRSHYQARFRIADLFLDTPIFNAMTTACDALAAGLPVLTIAGKSFPSRVAASLLTAARFPDGIVESLNAYRERAIYWGNNPEALLKLRTEVLADSSNMPLFDTEARVRQLEYAYEEMWRRHSLGLPPDSFDVVARKPAWRNAWH